MAVPKDTIPVFDRYSHRNYLLTRYSYDQIIEIINFYHTNVYALPDFECVDVYEMEGSDTHKVKVSINRLVFN